MKIMMADSAHCNEVLFCVIATPTAKLDVVNFKVGSRATDLAAPSVSIKNLATERTISFSAQLLSGTLGTDSLHEAFP
jgi:hypothetical protein